MEYIYIYIYIYKDVLGGATKVYNRSKQATKDKTTLVDTLTEQRVHPPTMTVGD
jgi:hypothetical protein